MKPRSTPECGTNSGYAAGCRCDYCRYAKQLTRKPAPRHVTVLPTIRPVIGEWINQAACRGLGDRDRRTFFSTNAADIRHAKTICRHCPVRAECLDHALRAHEPYVWGGESEQDREHTRQQREKRVSR